METQTNLNFNMSSNVGMQGLLTQQFFHLALERGLHEVTFYDTRSEATLAAMDTIFKGVKPENRYTYLPADPREREQWAAYMYDLGDTLVFTGMNNRYNWETMGVGRDRTKLDAIFEKIRKVLPVMKTGDPNIIPVNFWSMAGDDVRVRVRRMTVPSWEDMASNYTALTREQLEKLMTMEPPNNDHGRLILWHGVPGTGKSYGIRSLAQAWQKWCEIHYIVDPERFFGNADYMLQVILQNQCGYECPAPIGADDDEYHGLRWNLLIMEDSDEFLGVDAKQREGQSMARLLNLTSGFIGQGLNVLVLITTNEPIEKVHKALQREGRCMANIEFGKLSAMEAQEWAAKNDIAPDDAAGEQTIADLYAMGRQRQLRTGKVDDRPLGFQGVQRRAIHAPVEAKEDQSTGGAWK